MKLKIIAVACGLLVVIGATMWLSSRGAQENLPAGMQPLNSMRQAVSGKTVADVTKIVITTPWSNDPIVVTKKKHIEAFLRGMQKATQPKIQCGCAGPHITIVWKDGTKTFDFGFDTLHGAKHAFSKEFATAYNEVVPADRRIDLSRP